MIWLEVNGTRFDGFTRISANRSYSAVPASFSFVATTSPEDLTTFPILEGDACRVMIDDVAFITGYVDQIDVRHDDSTHEIAVEGRSLCSDLVDSTMNGKFEIEGPTTLTFALAKIIRQAGVSDITVIDNTGGADLSFTKNDNLSGKIGEQVWSFMASLAIKKQVLLTEDGDGNVVMTRGAGEKISDQLVKIPDGEKNNIKSSSVRRSQRERFYKFEVLSQDDSTSMMGISIGSYTADQPTEKENFVLDSVLSGRPGRCMCIIAEKASDNAGCKTRAQWQFDNSLVKAFAYSCQLQGFVTDSGYPWEPGMMPHIIDNYMQIDSELIIDSVSFSYSSGEGSTTELNFLSPNAYKLIASEPKNTGNDETGFFG